MITKVRLKTIFEELLYFFYTLFTYHLKINLFLNQQKPFLPIIIEFTKMELELEI